MKFIGHLQALSASRQVMEEYMPEKLPVSSEVISALRAKFSFQNFPDTSPGSPLAQTMTFAMGKYQRGDDDFGIAALVMDQTSDIAQAMTTDQADLVLDELAELMDEQFGFRLRANAKPRVYASNIVVEFDNAVEQYLGKLDGVLKLLKSNFGFRSDVYLKKLAFGSPEVLNTNTVAALERGDFTIERRVGAPSDSNRYFCSAPMRTKDHIATLEKIESILAGA